MRLPWIVPQISGKWLLSEDQRGPQARQAANYRVAGVRREVFEQIRRTSRDPTFKPTRRI